MNALQERALRITYEDSTSSYNELLETLSFFVPKIWNLVGAQLRGKEERPSQSYFENRKKFPLSL